MKRLFTLCVLALGLVTVNAQVTVQGSKFFDNWSIGIAGGAYTPTTNHAFFKSARPLGNLTITKQITPIFGMALDGTAFFNSKTLVGHHSTNVVDGLNLALLPQVNLSNLFCGYKGAPRFFEVVAFSGLGWGHLFFPSKTTKGDIQKDANYISAKSGLSLNLNLGSAKAWQINVKPAIVWNLEGNHYLGPTVRRATRDVNYSAVELTAGVTYKFNNSYGAHNFVVAKLYDQAEVDGLNAKINDLRSNLNGKDGEINAANAKIKDLQDQLNDCRNNKKPAEVITKTVYDGGSMVTFRQGKSVIDASQFANVERVASYMKNHKDAKVSIEGYASPEGSKAVNEKLATKRAEAVKSLLVKKYKIAADRISTTGKGVGNMFSEPDWNRVSISTIQK